mmetsp:Transcript_21624/g.71540  ORF Transcript_21624/g.71540 Transcript_21624/m.71540 type:complete len:323 (+) Transcript_21624:92-1060(+)
MTKNAESRDVYLARRKCIAASHSHGFHPWYVRASTFGSVASSSSTSTCCSGVRAVAGSWRRKLSAGPRTISTSRSKVAGLAATGFSRSSASVMWAALPPLSLDTTEASRLRAHAASLSPSAAPPPSLATTVDAWLSPSDGSSTLASCASPSLRACFAQSTFGSETNTSITRRSSSRWARSVRSTSTMCPLSSTPESSGRRKEVSWRVSRTPISSGCGSWWVAEPNAWPKSMPTTRPLASSTMKFSRWRSPMPRRCPTTVTTARERAKQERVARNDSAPTESDSMPRERRSAGNRACASARCCSASLRLQLAHLGSWPLLAEG